MRCLALYIDRCAGEEVVMVVVVVVVNALVIFGTWWDHNRVERR